MSAKVEDKLYQNRYLVDAQHAHVRIKDEALCARCTTRQCTVCCPAGCYADDAGKVVLTTDGCLECGTCRVICTTHRNLDWEYPRGGHGIQFKFG